MTRPRAQHGVTLIELMIVIVLLAIAVGIAVPSYRNYVLRTHRTDATAALLRLRSAQERFFLQNDFYIVTAAGLMQAPPAGLGVLSSGGNPISEHGYFQLGIGVDPTAPVATPSFQITATATATGGQLEDTDCRTLSITDRGVRGATDAGGATSPAIVERCWR